MQHFEGASIQYVLDEKVIGPAYTECASPGVAAPKTDGTLRFCVDNRKLNALITTDSYPIPQIDYCIDSLRDEEVFSTLDANNHYRQIKMANRSKDLTTFTSHFEVFQFFSNSLWIEERPCDFLARHEFHLSVRALAVCVGVSG